MSLTADAPAADAPPAAVAPSPPRPAAPGNRLRTAADLPALLDRLGGVPASRVRLDPPPGSGTWEDVDRVRRQTGTLCELIDGTLVEKAVSDWTSFLGLEIGRLIATFVRERRLGVCHGSDGFFHFGGDLRGPDVSFTPKERRRGGLLRRGYSDVPPALVVEVLSPGNTRREMALKRRTYFTHGVRCVWEVGEDRVTVWDGPDSSAEVGLNETLRGEPALPGFALPLAELFADPLADGDVSD